MYGRAWFLLSAYRGWHLGARFPQVKVFACRINLFGLRFHQSSLSTESDWSHAQAHLVHTPGERRALNMHLANQARQKIGSNFISLQPCHRARGGDRGARPPYECEFSTENFKIQINFKNLTLLAPLTFKKTTFWLRPWAGYVKRDTR